MNLKPADLAKRLAVSTKTLANWRVLGRGPAFFKAGSLVRYPLAAVEEWEEAHTVTSTAAAAAGGSNA